MIRFILLTLLTLLSAIPGDCQDASWQYATGGRVRSRPAVTESGVVYALSEDRYLYAIEEEKGKLLWRSYLGGRVWDSLAISRDGTIITVLKNGEVVAVNPHGGIIWRREMDGTPVGAPAIGIDGAIIVAFENGRVASITHHGFLSWETSVSDAISAPPAVTPEGLILIPSDDATLHALRPGGTRKWKAVLAGTPTAPAISREGMIYVGTDFGSIVAIDEEGTILWDHIEPNPFLSPVIGEKGVIGVTRGGTIVQLDDDGTELSKTTEPAQFSGAPAVDKYGGLYVPTTRGTIVHITGQQSTYTAVPSINGVSGFTLSQAGTIIVPGVDWLLYGFSGTPAHDQLWAQPGLDATRRSSYDVRMSMSEIESMFADNGDFIFLRSLIFSDTYESKLTALSAIEDRILRGEIGDGYLYIRHFLEMLASEGTIRVERREKKIINDFPDIRSRAAGLLARIGGIHSSRVLARSLDYEHDVGSAAAMIRAIGTLGSDLSGDATRAIAETIKHDIGLPGPPEPTLGIAAALALKSILSYNGVFPDESGYETVLMLFRNDYPKTVREAALNVLSRRNQ